MDHKDLKNVIDRVRSKIPDEALSEVSSDLKAIESGYLEVSDSARVASSEAKDRKIKLREKDSDIENLTIERDEWKTKYESFDDSDLKSERDKYKEKYDNYIKTQKSAFQDFFKNAIDKPAWNKVKEEYILPDKDGDDFKWDDLKADELEKNINNMNYHTKLELFKTEKQSPDVNTGKQFIEGKQVPTSEEYQNIRNEYGVHSPQAMEALELRRKVKGSSSVGFTKKSL